MNSRALAVPLCIASAGVFILLARNLDLPLALLIFAIAIVAIAAVFGIAPRDGAGFNPLFVLAILAIAASLVAGGIWLISRVHPLIFATACAAIIATATFVLLRRRDRQRELLAISGCCEHCGYDLRESFERCPECGQPIPEELQRRRRIAVELAAKQANDQSARDKLRD